MSTKNEIAKLGKMKVKELQAKFAEVTGEKTRSPNRTFLVRKITEAAYAREVVDASSPGAKTATTVATKAADPGPEKLTRLAVAELQARYLEAIGRSTGSTNKAYLIWKIREAKKGRIPVGPRKNARREGVTFKVLPMRMETEVVDKLDEAWRSFGIKNRMEFSGERSGAILSSLAPMMRQRYLPVPLPWTSEDLLGGEVSPRIRSVLYRRATGAS